VNNVDGQITGTIMYLLIFFAIIYFLMIRPQQQQQKKRRQMLENIKVADEVVTIGGLHGRVVKLKEDEVILKVDEKMELTFDKSAIGRIKAKDSEEA